MKNNLFILFIVSSLMVMVSCKKEETPTTNNPDNTNYKIKSINYGNGDVINCSYNAEGLPSSFLFNGAITFNFIWSPTTLTLEFSQDDSTGQTVTISQVYPRNSAGYVLPEETANPGWEWTYNSTNQVVSTIEGGSNFTDISWANGNYTTTTTNGSVGSNIIGNYNYSSEIETRDAGGKYFPPLTGNFLSVVCFPNKNLLSSYSNNNGSLIEYSYQKDSKGRIISESRLMDGTTSVTNYTYFD